MGEREAFNRDDSFDAACDAVRLAVLDAVLGMEGDPVLQAAKGRDRDIALVHGIMVALACVGLVVAQGNDATKGARLRQLIVETIGPAIEQAQAIQVLGSGSETIR